MSAFSMKTWLKKGYSEEESRYQIAIRRPTNILYYINKGLSQDEAKIALNEFSKLGSKKWVEKTTASERKKSRNTCVEYYLERGLSVEEAELARSQRQETFSLEKCILKLGEVEGTRVWRERQEKWQSTINAKSDEELADINSRKNSWKDLSEYEYESRRSSVSENAQKFWDNVSVEYKIEFGKNMRESFVRLGKALPLEELEDQRRYNTLVDQITRCQPIDTLENFDLRAPNNFHLDHKYSKLEGFKNTISPEVIGHICNLEMIPYQENTSKSSKCSITLETLLENIERYNAKNQQEDFN
jgi:hypothetical protein